VPFGWSRTDPFVERLWGVDDPAVVRSIRRTCQIRSICAGRWAVLLIVLLCASFGLADVVQRLAGLHGWAADMARWLVLGAALLLLFRWCNKRALRELPEVLRSLGRCPVCGYDVSKATNRVCPECGHDARGQSPG